MIKKDLLSWIAENYDNDEEILCVLWSKEDVEHKEKKMGFILTPEERKEVLRRIKNEYDAEWGINWDTMESYIDAIYEERENTK